MSSCLFIFSLCSSVYFINYINRCKMGLQASLVVLSGTYSTRYGIILEQPPMYRFFMLCSQLKCDNKSNDVIIL